MFTWEGEAEKESKEKMWPRGRMEPSDGQGQAGRGERGSQFAVKWPGLGQLGPICAGRPQLQQSVDLLFLGLWWQQRRF